MKRYGQSELDESILAGFLEPERQVETADMDV